MKHNNVVPTSHFHKDWQNHVRTWFNQPAKKVARRNARVARAQKIAPRPLELLRPAVHCQTVKYNRKLRAGRGFTLDELRAAEISPKEARSIGICVDHRRKNRSEESLTRNVERLAAYKARLVVFPRKPNSQRVKKGDASKEERAAATQVVGSLPIVQDSKRVKARKITEEERNFNAVATVRAALMHGKLWGRREKRAREKAAEAAKKAPAAEE